MKNLITKSITTLAKTVAYISILCLPVIVYSSQTSTQLYVASDYIGDGIFTQGIEGPAVDSNDQLYAVNYASEGTIGIITKKGHADLFLQLPTGSTGNGIRFDKNDTMYIADYTGHNILKANIETKTVTVYAHSDQMNQPNDIAISHHGILYASDPNWSNGTGNLWKINTDASISMLENSMGTTNGIEVSADEKHLYVNESVQRKVWVYDILANGDITNKRLLIEFPDHGLDGMRCDSKGNLFIARYGAGSIAMVSPTGVLIREIKLKGKNPTNVAFGGQDGKTIFVTMQTRGAIEYFTAQHSGRAWQLNQYDDD